MSEAPAFFAVEALSKSFGALVAVDRISFAVARGEVLGIAGPNGSGKSTLFNIITNIPFRADSGRVFLEGERVDRLASHLLCQLGIVRTFQRESVFPSLSAIDNVLTAVEQSGRGGSFKENVVLAEQALDLVGFPATLHNHPAASLPIFFRKLVMIGSAMALDPKVLLLDEPASSLTPEEIGRMDDLIRRLNGLGVTVLLIEHILPLLTGLSDRMMVLDQGRLISEGTPERVIKDPAVVEAYLGEGA